MRSFLIFVAFVGSIVATIGWILCGTREIRNVSLPDNYSDEGL